MLPNFRASELCSLCLALQSKWNRCLRARIFHGDLLTHPLPSKLSDLFGIDTRTLALFRIVLAALVLFDLLARAQYLEYHYTDAGILPTLMQPAFRPSLSLHWLDGSFGFQAALLCVAVAAAAALLLGYRTTLATFVCWALLKSLHSRNPHLNEGGDAIARMMLMWSIFLSLGTRFSLDAKRGATVLASRIFSPASVAILMQFVIFYMVAGIAKSGPAWLDGTAVAASLNDSYRARPLAEVLLKFPAMLEFLTFSTRGLEVIGPLLLFLPVFIVPIRIAIVLAFGSLQLGLGMSIDLNLFPFFATALALVLVPSWFWDRFFPRTKREVQEVSEASKPGVRGVVAGTVVVTLLVVSLVLVGDPTGWFRTPPSLKRATRFLGIEQGWRLYAPDPPLHDLQYRILGTRVGDSQIITLASSNKDVNLEAPGKEITDFHANYRTRAYLRQLLYKRRNLESHRQLSRRPQPRAAQ